MSYDTTSSARLLHRSVKNRLIAGVCSGFAEYLNIDPLIVRLAWVGLALWGGIGIVAYIAAMLLIPSEMSGRSMLASIDGKLLIGIVLVVLGLTWLLSGSFYYLQLQISHYLLPIVVVSLGVVLLYRKGKVSESGENADGISDEGIDERIGWSRSSDDRIIFGVCGGLGKYLNLDPNIVRVLWGVMTVSFFLAGIALYLLLYVIMPRERSSSL